MAVMRLRGVLLTVVLLAASMPGGAVEPRSFDDPARQQRYEALLEELRCMVCQNESIATSDADLAQDMRREVYRMIEEGRSNEAIEQFLVERYGEFVLYRPRVSAKTYLLWFGPALLLLGGAIALVVTLRQRARAGPADLDEAERARLAELLGEDDGDRGHRS